MKKIFLLALLFVFHKSFGQENAIDKYFKDFQQKNSLGIVTVSSKMFTVFLESKQGKEKEELSNVLKKLSGLKVLSTSTSKNGDELYNSACALMPNSFETILTIKETDRNARFFTKENAAGKIIELVMVAFQWGRFLVVSITGDINLNDILKLSQNLNLQGLGDVQKQKVLEQ